jgi:hypothetical protein
LTWFNKHPTRCGPQVFNKTRKSCGIPNVSAIGMNYIVAVAENEPYVPSNTYELVFSKSLCSTSISISTLSGFLTYTFN